MPLTRISERASKERARHNSLDTMFAIIDADLDVGGGIIAGALAYRLFVWLLPLALVLIAALGFLARWTSTTPESAADSLALAGLVSRSVAGAAESPTRWYALLVGVPTLVLATRSVLRVLIGAHRLVWGEPRESAPKPTVRTAVRLLALITAFYLVTAAANWVQARAGAPLTVATFVGLTFADAAIWLLISIRLPHRSAAWTALIPGAILFALGAELLQGVSAFLIAPYALNKQGTYGALGIAAVLLVALFMMGRLMVATAEVNATIWKRRSHDG